MALGIMKLFSRKNKPIAAEMQIEGCLCRMDTAAVVKHNVGFDGNAENQSAGWVSERFEVTGKPSRYILLRDDGTYTDTTLGSEINGKYHFDGVFTYMLTPLVGGYCNLTISADNITVERVEAAGGRMTLVRADG